MSALWQRVFRSRSAVLAYWGYRVVAAWFLALPLVGIGASVGVAQSQAADRGLFEPGGLLLLEALRLGMPQLEAHAEHVSLALLLLGYLGLVPLAGLLIGLQPRATSEPWKGFGAAWSKLPSFSVLLGMVLLGQGAVVLFATLLAPFAVSLDARYLNPPAADLALLGLVLVVALAVGWLGVVQDLARALLAAGESSSFRALRSGLALARHAGFTLLLRWLATLALSILLVVGAGSLTSLLAVEREQTWRWLTVLVIHQAVVLALVCVRAVWLGQLVLLTEDAVGTLE